MSEGQKRKLEPWEIEVANAAARDMPGVAEDFRRGVSSPSSMLGPSKAEPQAKGTGWIDPAPLKVPEGTKYVDQICDAFDAAERRQREALAKSVERLKDR
jgi:hypothetical protein